MSLTVQEVTSISITTEELTSNPVVGNAFIIKAYTEPSASSVTFQSSDPSVISLVVDDSNDYTEYGSCIAKVLSAGSVRIRVKSGSLTSYVDFTCVESDSSSDSSSSAISINLHSMIDLNVNYVKLPLGGDFQLLVRTNPPGLPVVWSSSNPNVAFINETGLISACGAGDATITVTTRDGSSASCYALIADLDIKGEFFNLGIGQKMKVPFGQYPSAFPIQWISDNSNVAYIDPKGYIRANSPGVTIVTGVCETNTGPLSKQFTVKVSDYFEPLEQLSPEMVQGLKVYRSYEELVSDNQLSEYRVIKGNDKVPTLYYLRTTDNPYLYEYKIAALLEDITKFRLTHG